MINLWNTFEMMRGSASSEAYITLTKSILGAGDKETLRKLSNSQDVYSNLIELIEANVFYSDFTKNEMIKEVKRISKLVSISQVYDLIFTLLKALESSKALEIIDEVYEQQSNKYGDMRADKAQTAIVKQYFNVQNGQTLFSGRIGHGFEITDLLDGNTSVAISAQDISTSYLTTAEIRLHLAGYTDVKIEAGDVLTNYSYEGRKFDFVYDTPRFGIKPLPQTLESLKDDPRYQYYGLPSKMNVDLGYVVADIHALNDTGKGAFYLTTGALSRSGADEKIRERLIVSDIVEAVIEFPGGLLAPATAISSVLLLINKAKPAHAKGKILFINASTLTTSNRKKITLTDEGLEQIIAILNTREEVSGISKIINTTDLIDYELLPSRYIFESSMNLVEYGLVNVNLSELNKLKTVPLSKIATIYRGYNALPKDEKADGNVAMLKIADIVNGEIQDENLTRYELGGRVKIDNYRIQKEDIVLSIRGQLKVALFDSEREDVLLSQNFIGIRCNRNFDPAFVKLYLESPTMQFIMHNKLTGSTILNLPTKDIEEFMIPELPLEKQREIVAKYNLEQEKLKQELDKVIEELKVSKLNVYKEMGISTTFDIK